MIDYDSLPSIYIPTLPAPVFPPRDRVVSGNTTLANRVNYYRNLTINTGVTLTGVVGGTIIVVQQTLNVVGNISVNALGTKGYQAIAGQSRVNGGAFGGAYPNNTTSIGFSPRSLGSFFSQASVINSTTPWGLADPITAYMGSGGQSTNNAPGTGGNGGAGGAWPFNAAGPFGLEAFDPQDWNLLVSLLDFIRAHGARVSAQWGGVGGGAGGGGGSGTSGTSQPGVTASMGWGTNGPATNQGGASGGSGIGGGGAGGQGGNTSGGFGTGTGGAGGNGGGILVIICGTLSGGGTISANGENGDNGNGVSDGGGGGGGGGAALVSYHDLGSSTPTIQANGGSGGSGGTPGASGAVSGGNGGAGGAGIATSFLINVGL